MTRIYTGRERNASDDEMGLSQIDIHRLLTPESKQKLEDHYERMRQAIIKKQQEKQ